jgi:hypothetical protein
MNNFRPIDRRTRYLLPPSVEDWLPERHLAGFVVEIIDQLDLSAMSRAYRGSGSAISNTRLIACDGRGVTFRYKDYRADGLVRRKAMTLATDEFIRRFLLHILPKGFHRIRHYGLFANTSRAANIVRLRELLGSAPPAQKAASPCRDEPAETVLPPCPCCGGRMIVIEYFERGMQPRYHPPFTAVIWFDTS